VPGEKKNPTSRRKGRLVTGSQGDRGRVRLPADRFELVPPPALRGGGREVDYYIARGGKELGQLGGLVAMH